MYKTLVVQEHLIEVEIDFKSEDKVNLSRSAWIKVKISFKINLPMPGSLTVFQQK